MKHHIEKLIHTALKHLQQTGELPVIPAFIQIDSTKDNKHGDYAANIALLLAKTAQKKPRDIAERIVACLPSSSYLDKVEIAGPGFINFFMSPTAYGEIITQVLTEKRKYGRAKVGRGKRILIEFLSSNPTGPLHVGHGRHAAFGSVVANLLDAVGFKTFREYYVNDAGRQMDILTVSVWLRYLECCGEDVTFPVNAYQGDYVKLIAQALYAAHEKHFCVSFKEISSDLPADEPAGGDKEIYIDKLIEKAKLLLNDKYVAIYDLALENILADMREDLNEFGVQYDNWFSERQFVATGAVHNMLEKLKQSGYTYMQEGALWFRSTDLGDEKDRVLVRSNGQYTYFAPDIAYHLTKFERGFDIAIDIFGSDHHGYLARMKAAMQASEINPERLISLLVQFVSLYRGGKPAQMSTRGGSFVTLRELRSEVGNDAARFFYVMRKSEQPLDFDLDLAKAQTNENPVFYIQYAHARICSVLKQLTDKRFSYSEEAGLANVDKLSSSQERQLMNTIASYPDMIMHAALQYEPHQLTNYLRELATHFHAYYNSHQFIVEDEALRNARLALVMATKQLLTNGLDLLGITAPESM